MRRSHHRLNLLLASWLLCWTVTATSVRTIDGDTFDATLSIWFGLTAQERIRVLGVDTPELHGATLAAAKVSKDFTEQWLAKGPVEIEACKRDSFGRVLGTVRRDGDSLATALIAAGLGVPYKK